MAKFEILSLHVASGESHPNRVHSTTFYGHLSAIQRINQLMNE